jgi:hypothetical protein
MTRVCLVVVGLLLVGVAAAPAQDVQGIELCSRETQMDRRTGCLQSNIEYLQKVIAKNAADARQNLAVARGEVAALKGENGTLRSEVATLKSALSSLQARIDHLEAAARPHVPPAAKPAQAPAQPAAPAPAAR